MKLQFRTLDKAHYAALDADELFPSPAASRCYGVVLADNRAFKFSWQSDLVAPVVIPVADAVFLAGIDTTVALAGVTHGVLLACTLPDFFVNSFLHGGFVFVATEFSVWKLTVTEQAIMRMATYDLPDVYESYALEQEELVVYCQDGSRVRIA